MSDHDIPRLSSLPARSALSHEFTLQNIVSIEFVLVKPVPAYACSFNIAKGRALAHMLLFMCCRCAMHTSSCAIFAADAEDVYGYIRCPEIYWSPGSPVWTYDASSGQRQLIGQQMSKNGRGDNSTNFQFMTSDIIAAIQALAG